MLDVGSKVKNAKVMVDDRGMLHHSQPYWKLRSRFGIAALTW